jgi:signal peptidase II
MKKKLFIFCIALFGLVALDQIVKALARSFLATSDLDLTSFCQLTLLYNKGVSWSFLTPTSFWQEQALFFGILVLLVGYSFYVYTELQTKRSDFPQVLILSGAISNLIDRIVYGGVVDFILLHYRGYQFPVFNGADLLIFIGFLFFLKKGVFDEFC